MKKVIYALILPMVVVSGLVFANSELNNETSKKSIPKPLSAAEMNAELKKMGGYPRWYKVQRMGSVFRRKKSACRC